jgi:hypothetical protein
MCAGMHLANNYIVSCYDIVLGFGSLELLNMNFVWAFNFALLINKKPIFPSRPQRTGLYAGMLTSPEPFQCSITPSSAGCVKTIGTEFVDAINTFLRNRLMLTADDNTWI